MSDLRLYLCSDKGYLKMYVNNLNFTYKEILFEEFEEGSDVGKAMHWRDDFGRSVWQRVMETQNTEEVRLHM